MSQSKSDTKRKDMARALKPLPYPEVREKIIETTRTMRMHQERLPIDASLGRVCAEDVISPRDVPALPLSAMDGYAIRSGEIAKADASHPVRFNVIGSVYAGSQKPSSTLGGRDAFYVATGAPIPEGADAVVRVEETRLAGGRISVFASIPKWKNVALPGEDIRGGEVAVARDHVVNAADIALLVSAGKRDLAVVTRPRVGILSTGDELTTPDKVGQGKMVNNYANLVAGYTAQTGAIPVLLGVARDNGAEILGVIERSIGSLDVIITIGGSSVGKNDITPDALRSAGNFVEVFHGIRLIPVRPTGLFTVRGKPVVLLPSHAVAASLSFFLVVSPIINLLSGLDFDYGLPTIRASSTEALSNPRPIGALFLAKLTANEGAYEATPLRWGSNLISNLASAHGYFQLAPHQALKVGQGMAVTLLGADEISRIPRRAA